MANLLDAVGDVPTERKKIIDELDTAIKNFRSTVSNFKSQLPAQATFLADYKTGREDIIDNMLAEDDTDYQKQELQKLLAEAQGCVDGFNELWTKLTAE